MAMINYTQAVIPQTLPAGDFEAYTVPTKTVTQVRAATFFNKSASPITLKVSVVPSGATLGVQHQVAQKNIPAGNSYLSPEIINHVLKSGDKLYISGEGLNAYVSVMEQVL
ncbi:TPA: hypothetical protein U2H88_003531 [Acinetobacter nosocomialis]|nr:hypothetical protein [Acinetobacter nosocomialis]